MAQRSVRSPSPLRLKGPSPPPDLLNTDGTLMLFASSSCSRTGYVCVCVVLVFGSLGHVHGLTIRGLHKAK